MNTCPYCGRVADLIIESNKKTTYKCQSCLYYFEVLPKEGHNIQETSIQAKKEIDKSGLCNTQRSFIYHLIKEKDGLTIKEIADLTKIQKSSISARINELAKEGVVKDSGRKEINGKEGIVWKCCRLE